MSLESPLKNARKSAMLLQEQSDVLAGNYCAFYRVVLVGALAVEEGNPASYASLLTAISLHDDCKNIIRLDENRPGRAGVYAAAIAAIKAAFYLLSSSYDKSPAAEQTDRTFEYFRDASSYVKCLFDIVCSNAAHGHGLRPDPRWPYDARAASSAEWMNMSRAIRNEWDSLVVQKDKAKRLHFQAKKNIPAPLRNDMKFLLAYIDCVQTLHAYALVLHSVILHKSVEVTDSNPNQNTDTSFLLSAVDSILISAGITLDQDRSDQCKNNTEMAHLLNEAMAVLSNPIPPQSLRTMPIVAEIKNFCNAVRNGAVPMSEGVYSYEDLFGLASQCSKIGVSAIYDLLCRISRNLVNHAFPPPEGLYNGNGIIYTSCSNS